MASKEELRAALEGLDVPQLQEMGKRLQKSHADMEAMLQEMQEERKALDTEREYFEKTIELMMKELHKLNIGAGNISDPLLEEGPLDFVGRFWEKVRPRDTAVAVSEHVGEIKKPTMDGSPTAQQFAKQVTGQLQENLQARGQQALEQSKVVSAVALEHGKQAVEQGKQVWGRLSQSIGPLWQRAEGAFGYAAGGEPPVASAAEKSAKKRERKAKKEAEAAAASSASASAPAAGSAAAPADIVDMAAQAAAAAAAQAAAAKEAEARAQQKAAEEKAAAEEQQKAAAEEQISSTILIEASLTLDDGSVQLLQVRAADRCKEVASRFVQEHSLKAWFAEPLTAWLKKVESDAEKFPVKVEGDLMEIRKAHSKK
eukprot:TRINITY_DN71907_c0_g1_i1.p1 TRINITY_DN71907_c0_g1~~TRINITY_DN71907_c0_g1_i1.p1  ORF type:complete len:371 (-),score=141.06 TRINITY_DN71907_c0_g1_i1:122-1234(-)